MNIITSETGPAIEMSKRQQLWTMLRHRWIRFRRRCIPHLVWHGDEIDVGVHFKNLGALGGDFAPRLWEAQRLLHDLGIGFDSGSGLNGRDWEWDWSLSGPISVTFKSPAKKPERRMVRQRPDLKLVS